MRKRIINPSDREALVAILSICKSNNDLESNDQRLLSNMASLCWPQNGGGEAMVDKLQSTGAPLRGASAVTRHSGLAAAATPLREEQNITIKQVTFPLSVILHLGIKSIADQYKRSSVTCRYVCAPAARPV